MRVMIFTLFDENVFVFLTKMLILAPWLLLNVSYLNICKAKSKYQRDVFSPLIHREMLLYKMRT